MTLRRQRFIGPLIGCVTLVLAAGALAVVEFAFRPAGIPLDRENASPDHVQFLLDVSAPYFRVERVNDERFLVQNPPPGRIFHGPEPQTFPLKKRPGTYRLAVVGESNAVGLGRALKDAASAGWSAGRVEIMNCGIGGSSLEQMDKVLQELWSYDLDGLIVVFGHNLMLRHKSLKPLSYRAGRLARKSRFMTWLILRCKTAPDRPDEDRPDRLRAWEDFLRRTARRARERNVRVFGATLQGNLWYPPVAAELDRTDPRFLETIYLRAAGNQDAARRLERLLDERSPALWHFRLADWLYADGRFREAFDELAAARDRDPGGHRVFSGTDGTLRRLAREEGFDIIDLAGVLDRQGERGIPGWDVFSDGCHPRDYISLANVCLRRLETAGLTAADIRRDPDAAPAPADDADALLARARSFAEDATVFPDPRLEGLGYWVSSRLERGRAVAPQALEASVRQAREPAVPGAIHHQALVFHALAEGFARAGAWKDAFHFNREAAFLAPSWPQPFIQRALFQLERRRPQDARASLREALRTDPEEKAAQFFLRRLEDGGRLKIE